MEAPLGDSKDDVKQAIKVLQSCYPKLIVGHEVIDALKNNWIVQVAKAGSKIIAVLVAQREMKEIYIRRIAVLPEFRRKGFARGLVSSVARLDHVDVVTMAVPGWDPEAVAFAHRCFFHLFGLDADCDGHQLWRLSSRADSYTRNRLEEYFASRISRKGDFGRRC